jgi:beta-D-xylosidase 4
LHYTNFTVAWDSVPSTTTSDIPSLVNKAGGVKDLAPFATLTASVKNTGGPANLASDYVGLLFLSSSDAGSAPRPNKQLVSYGRLHGVKVGSSQQLSLTVNLGALASADDNGNLYIYPGHYTLAFDIDSKLTFNFTLTGAATLLDSLPQNAATVTAYEDLGCYPSSALSGSTVVVGNTNNPQVCVNTCAAKGSHFAGAMQK